MASSKNQSSLKKLVYETVRQIPRGKVATYGQIVHKLKSESEKLKIDARVVGWMLHLNDSPDVPCHRVVDRNGRLAPNYAFGGYLEQKKRLETECVKFKGELHVDLDKCLWFKN